MIITKKGLPRRTVLRGLGAALALPWLDSMVPALTALAKSAVPARRLGVFYVPNGMSMGYWSPKVFAHMAGTKNTTHQCGTLVFGTDPRTSVLDPWCRAHDVANLFVVDASFFPSSAAAKPGSNPCLPAMSPARLSLPSKGAPEMAKFTSSADRKCAASRS